MALAQQFAPHGQVLDVQEYGQGNVNDTYLVTQARASEARFILQRLNTGVFRQPELVMGNLTTVTEHVRVRLAREPLPPGRRFELPRVLPARDGRDHLIDEQGSFWRALSFIDGAETFEIITNEPQAQEVGAALGLFHRLLADLPPAAWPTLSPAFTSCRPTWNTMMKFWQNGARRPLPRWIFASASSTAAGPGPQSWKRPKSKGSSGYAPYTATPR
jgi:hypothetical protein